MRKNFEQYTNTAKKISNQQSLVCQSGVLLTEWPKWNYFINWSAICHWVHIKYVYMRGKEIVSTSEHWHSIPDRDGSTGSELSESHLHEEQRQSGQNQHQNVRDQKCRWNKIKYRQILINAKNRPLWCGVIIATSAATERMDCIGPKNLYIRAKP